MSNDGCVLAARGLQSTSISASEPSFRLSLKGTGKSSAGAGFQMPALKSCLLESPLSTCMVCGDKDQTVAAVLNLAQPSYLCCTKVGNRFGDNSVPNWPEGGK